MTLDGNNVCDIRDREAQHLAKQLKNIFVLLNQWEVLRYKPYKKTYILHQ